MLLDQCLSAGIRSLNSGTVCSRAANPMENTTGPRGIVGKQAAPCPDPLVYFVYAWPAVMKLTRVSITVKIRSGKEMTMDLVRRIVTTTLCALCFD